MYKIKYIWSNDHIPRFLQPTELIRQPMIDAVDTPEVETKKAKTIE
jgi:hypothetical protein